MKLTKDVETRLTKDSPKQGTVLVMDFTGCTVEDVADLAAATLVINTQAKYRRDEVVPPKDTIMVKDYVAGIRRAIPVTVDGLAAKANAMSAEERQRLIALLTAGK